MQQRKLPKKFSYVEALVILTVLAGVGVLVYYAVSPVCSCKEIEMSVQEFCMVRQHQLAQAIVMSAEEHGDVLPTLSEQRPWPLELGELASDELCDCPATEVKGSMTVPEYGFNANLSGIALKTIPDPNTMLLIADLHRTYGNRTAALRNWETDLATPHDNGTVMTTVDGAATYFDWKTAPTKRAALAKAGITVELPKGK